MATKATKSAKQDSNLLFIFAYLLTWLSGIILYITVGQKDKRVKFHSLQAIFLGIVIFILAYIPIISLVSILVWLYGLYIGYTPECPCKRRWNG